MNEVVILSALRTPTGAYGGGLSSLSAVELGIVAVQAAVEKSALPINELETIVMGNVISANLGQNPARQVALGAGMSTGTCATNVNKICASGLKALQIVMHEIALGQIDAGVAGGMESMSQVPHYLPNARFGTGFGGKTLVDGLEKDGLVDAFSEKSMGVCADLTAEKYGFSREDQDEYSQGSFEKARAANFDAELIPMTVQRNRQEIRVEKDEQVAKGNFDKMKTLRPAFTKMGTVTAGNASSMSDGASAVVLCNRSKIEAFGLKPLAAIVAYAEAEHEPTFFTTAPVSATKRVLTQAGLTITDIDLFEVNEAFAVVALAYQRELQIPNEKLNVKGGAVALGHALGSSGCRILVTLVHALKEQNKRYGLAAICNGGGGASAMIIENFDYVQS
jgi:acetyl-CoA C-acetyltransferase